MSSDRLYFLAGVAALILYLCWSAATEMGTRWFWQESKSSTSNPSTSTPPWRLSCTRRRI